MKKVRIKASRASLFASVDEETVLASCPLHVEFLQMFGFLSNAFPSSRINLNISSQARLFRPDMTIYLPLNLDTIYIKVSVTNSKLVTVNFDSVLSNSRDKNEYTMEEAFEIVVKRLEELCAMKQEEMYDS